MNELIDECQVVAIIARITDLLASTEGAQPLVRYAATYAAAGLLVFPVNPQTKTPLVSQYQATTDLDIVAGWWKLWPDALIGRLLPPEKFILDIDPKHRGDTTWEALEDTFGPIPVGRMHYSGRGDGGFHAEFLRPDWLARISAKRLHEWAREHEVGAPILDKQTGEVRRWTSGIDVLHHKWRYTILPPSPHPVTGQPYFWREANGEVRELLLPVAQLLVPLTEDKDEDEAEPSSSNGDQGQTPTSIPLSVIEHGDSVADWVSATMTWPQILQPHGWTLVHGDGNSAGSLWRHPDATTEHSASVKHGCLFVYTPNTVFTETEEGNPSGYTRFAAWALLDHGGDQSAAALAARTLKNATAPPPMIHVAESTAVLDGAAFVLDEPVDTAARWGRGGDVLWQHGESLLLVGPTGVGKTTVAGQLVGGLIGVLPDVLGFPVLPAKRVLYLAMDRPRQIQRALRRLFNDTHRQALAERLVVRRGPLPSDIGRKPEILVEIAQEFAADVLIGDSLKDAAVKLTDDEVAGNINRAIQWCNVADIDVLFLHHQRKGSDGHKPKSLEDVYGNTWITAGTGSVVLLWGEAGSELVELTHLKQPAELVGPLTVEHDHHAGTSRVTRGWDALAYLTLCGAAGSTIAEATHAHHGAPQTAGGNKWKKTERRLRSLVLGGLATATAQTSVGSPVRYFAVPPIVAPRGHARGHGSP